MLRYRLDHNAEAWQEFLAVSHALDLWMDDQAPKLATQRERDLLQQMKAAYADYQRLVAEARAEIDAGAQPPSAGQFPQIRAGSQRLFDLGQDLAKAHYESRNQLVAHADHTLGQLRFSVLALLAGLFVFGMVLAAVAYRDMVTPLRVKLAATEATAERNEKLASLGLLAAGVAHEIRNPLTAIKAALFIQQKKLQPGSPEHADAKLVEREISRLERIVTDFLHFARPAEPKLAALPADAPLMEVEHFFNKQLAAAGIRLVHEQSPSAQINVDPEQIKQVLINLVQNAADSIGSEGSITLRTRAAREHLANGETDVVILEVADTGAGIAPEVQKRLFDPFFTTKERGTGLGLSIAARIVENHGGKLQYRTQVNRGTTFGIVLPKANA
jgi:signal transduction histidine kinase